MCPAPPPSRALVRSSPVSGVGSNCVSSKPAASHERRAIGSGGAVVVALARRTEACRCRCTGALLQRPLAHGGAPVHATQRPVMPRVRNGSGSSGGAR
eukprot:scaffold1716_cov292-Prasinococcus_capsulatus_cf.AAC.2